MLVENINHTFTDILKLSIFSHFKTGNPVVDAIFSTLLLTAFSYFIRCILDHPRGASSEYISLADTIRSTFYRKNTIIYEGRQSYVIAKYDSQPIINMCCTDTFRALFYNILSKINASSSSSIHEIKEYITSRAYNSATDSDMYIITQSDAFLYDAPLQIYCCCTIITDNDGKDASKNGSKIITETITIRLFSYVSSIETIQRYVESIKNEYLATIVKSRNNKRFIYTLTKTKYSSETESRYECWNEHEFESTRQFHNMFFEGKADILHKIEFFLDNKDWYYSNGIPYSLGIGLHGPPGTGKTSFFKCLANMTNRHIVVISLKLIQTKRQLEDFFFEDSYNENNKKMRIGFDEKIIIFEDIDCMGDIVLNRASKKSKKTKREKNEGSVKKNRLCDAIEKLVENEIPSSPPIHDPITLDDLLNLWDGLRETPGRIMGISSNHYSELDPALVRPGRIDMTIHFENATRKIIGEMYSHYYGRKIDKSRLAKIRDRFYSPAEIINCYVLHKDSGDDFLDRLMENRKM